MAKLKAPLFSLGASQQLGKALVYFGWKGLNVVREYVIPSNPKTTLQTTQRDYLKDAVAMIHTAQVELGQPLNSDDVTAYAAWALIVKAATTWFNQAVKNWIDVKRAGNIPVIYRAGWNPDTDKDDFRTNIWFSEETASSIAAGHFFLGTTKTSLIQSLAATINVGTDAHLPVAGGFSGLSAGTKYFWQFRPDVGDLCEGANSGIYYAYAT